MAGGGNRQHAVLAPHRAGAERDGRADHLVDAQQLQGDGRPDDVHDAVDGADLVEVDLLDGAAVDLGLGLGQSVEDGPRPVGGPLGQAGVVDQVQDVGEAPAVVRLVSGRPVGLVRMGVLVRLRRLGAPRLAGRLQRIDRFQRLGRRLVRVRMLGGVVVLVAVFLDVPGILALAGQATLNSSPASPPRVTLFTDSV